MPKSSKDRISIFTSHGYGQSLIGSSAYAFANVTIKKGRLIKYQPIASDSYPGYNAGFQPTPKHEGIICEPIYVGDMSKWIDMFKRLSEHSEEPKFYENENGYVAKLDMTCCNWFIRFDKDGLLHSHDGAALKFGNLRSIWATHGKYTPGRINDYYNGDFQVSVGLVNVEDLSDNVHMRIEDTDIETIGNYADPAYVYGERYDVSVLAYNGQPFTN